MLRFLTAGESHGPSLTGVLEGMPAGLPLDSAVIDRELRRRQRGFGSGARMKIERDHAQITGGVMNGETTGGPIAFTINNRDHSKWANRDIAPMTVPRPGHADLTGAVKYGYRELRLSLERASARETAMRVAVGAACRALLGEFGVTIGGYVVNIGGVQVDAPGSADPECYRQRFAVAEACDVRCPDPAIATGMRAAIRRTIAARDTLGGTVEVAVLDAPVGLGSHVHWDRRLSTRLAAAAMSVPAVKAVEIGDGFREVEHQGTEVQDALYVAGRRIEQHSNHAGGIEGGISNGAPIVVRASLKPIATTLEPIDSVDLATGQPAKTRYERSDFCQVPRAVPILEAMVAFVLADALLQKVGGDSIAEMRPRCSKLRSMRIDQLPMDGGPWRFGYAD